MRRGRPDWSFSISSCSTISSSQPRLIVRRVSCRLGIRAVIKRMGCGEDSDPVTQKLLFLLRFQPLVIGWCNKKETEILTEKAVGLSRTAVRRRPFFRWRAALAILPLLGVVAAFGIAPDTATETVVLHRVIRDTPLVLPAEPGLATPSQYWREERIQRGDTIASLLARLQVTDRDAITYLRGAHHMRSLYQLVPGRTVRAVTSDDGNLISLRYMNSDGTELV